MEKTFFAAYSLIALCLAAIDFYFSLKAFRKPERIGKALGLCAAFAGEITLAYLVSVHAGSPRLVSLASSLCFAGIDWMLAALMFCALLATGQYRAHRSLRVAMWTVRWLALADTLVLMSNVFTGKVVGLVAQQPAGIVYEMKPLYIVHLVFTYAVVALTLAALVYKCLHTPWQYRDQYRLIIADILIVVAINALFLFPKETSFFNRVDCSVLGYSVGLYLMYWTAFSYRSNDMLKDLSMTIFENIDQGIVLFDYEDALIMQNRRAEALLGGVAFRRGLTREAFARDCGIREEGDHYSVQCDCGKVPLRCDFRRLRDERGGVIGNLFVFTDISRNTDINSGFEYAGDFTRYVAARPGRFGHPTAVAVFDITALKEVNRLHGRDEGDRRIRALAKRMQACLPEGATFLRGYEANLIAVCPGKTEADLLEGVRKVQEASESALVYGVGATGDQPERDAAQALETAYRAIRVKKLLNPGSAGSQTLTSLVRALEEADPDTEAHVRRTRKMGAALGACMGLTDAQSADLALLCLLHDIGKITIPLEILNKPGGLTDLEWTILRSHAEKGYQIAMSSDELKGIAEMVLDHHERWDGKGYPRGLAGEDIPILSRIIAIVDAYDAMVNDRAYRKALTPEAAQAEIRRCAGTQFDPKLTEAFLELLAGQPDIAVGEKVGGGEVRVFEAPVPLEGGAGETAPIAYSRYLLDMDERIIEVDPRFEEITGYTRGDVVGRMTQFDLVPAEDRTFYMMQVSDQFSRGNIAYLRHAIRRKDGTETQVACFGKRYYDSAVKAFRSEIVIFEI